MADTPFHIFLSAGLWNEDLVAGLNRRGYQVTLLNDEQGQIYISRHAWRIPAGIAQNKITEHIETILKQMKVLDHEADQTQGPQSEGVTTSLPVPTQRKKRVTKKAVTPGVQTPESSPTGDPTP